MASCFAQWQVAIRAVIFGFLSANAKCSANQWTGNSSVLQDLPSGNLFEFDVFVGKPQTITG
jgi:hypothetical protein